MQALIEFIGPIEVRLDELTTWGRPLRACTRMVGEGARDAPTPSPSPSCTACGTASSSRRSTTSIAPTRCRPPGLRSRRCRRRTWRWSGGLRRLQRSRQHAESAGGHPRRLGAVLRSRDRLGGNRASAADLPRNRGRDGVLERVLEAFEQVRQVPERFIDCGDQVLVFVRTEARERTAGLEIDEQWANLVPCATARSFGCSSSENATKPSKPPGLRSKRCRRRTLTSCAWGFHVFNRSGVASISALLDPDVVFDTTWCRLRPRHLGGATMGCGSGWRIDVEVVGQASGLKRGGVDRLSGRICVLAFVPIRERRPGRDQYGPPTSPTSPRSCDGSG